MSENVGALTSRNCEALHSLYRDSFIRRVFQLQNRRDKVGDDDKLSHMKNDRYYSFIHGLFKEAVSN
jgi:hypothetical protein